MKSRIVLFAGVLFVVWCLVVARGFQLQVLPQKRLQTLKEKRFQRTIQIDARRGDLLDRNGSELAVSVPRYSLFVDPAIVKEPGEITRRLARLLGIPKRELAEKVRRKGTRFVWIARKLSKEDHLEIQSWGLRGLGFKVEPQRLYPNSQLMSSVLGFVGAENRGLEGLERRLESYLSGDKKVMVLQRDARGRPLIENGWMFLKNEDGQDVRLTLDRDLQFFVEQQLDKVMQEFRADSASAVVVDVASAEVRAMANKFASSSGRWPRNSVVVDAYEPGSTLKSMLLAAALEEGVVHPNTIIDTGGGVMRIGRRTIGEADQKHSFESLTASEVLAKSSNVGSAQIAFLLGAEKYRRYLAEFGFGEKTGFDFPGEAKGILHQLPWRKEHLASVGFGHGMTASLLQMASAYTTLAFDGVHRRLKVVDAVRDPKDGRWKPVLPDEEPRRVVSKSVADTVSLMLAMATGESGTGRLARVPGFAVAGKTGTAQMVNPEGGGYLPGAYIASFAGYFPLPDPKFVIIVSVDNPKGPNYYGSYVAAPIFASIASHLSRHEGLIPRMITKSNVVKSKAELPWDYQKAQQQALSKLIQKNSAAQEEKAALLWRMPDLKGKSLREVKRALEGSQRPVVFSGPGLRVQATVPEAGTPLAKGQRVRVIF